MQNFFKKTICVLLCIAVLFSLSGCKSGKEILASLTNGKDDAAQAMINEIGFTLPYIRTDSLDPYKAEQTMNKYIAKLLYDSLFTVSSDFKPTALIAESYSINGNTLTVTIKNGLKFTDGTPLTAKDVVYSFELAKECADYVSMLENISNATYTNDTTLNFTLNTPTVDECANLVFPVIKYDSSTVSSNEDTEDDDTQKNAVSIPVGSGRYTFVTDNENKYLLVNTSRLGGYQPTYAKIGLYEVPQSENLQSLFSIKRIDFYCEDFNNGEFTKFTRVSANTSLTNLVYLGINSNNEALSEPKVRRAIALALDRSELVSLSFAGCAVATSLPFHPSFYKLSTCTVPTLKNKNDSAISLLESVGFSKVSDSGVRYSESNALNLTLLVNTENDFRLSLARSIQQALEKVNIKVTLRETSYSDYASSVKTGSFDLYIGETKLSNNFDLSRFFSEDGGLNTGISDSGRCAKVYDQYRLGKVELQSFIDTFADELPFIPISFRQGIAAGSDKFASTIVTAPGDCFANIKDWTVK